MYVYAITDPPDAKHELRSIRWSPERDGASFHIPLHRNLMAFVHSVASASATNTFLQDRWANSLSQLPENPLARVCVVCRCEFLTFFSLLTV